jgi:dTDP-4-dehydrorhamnose 3,5-epimerase
VWKTVIFGMGKGLPMLQRVSKLEGVLILPAQTTKDQRGLFVKYNVNPAEWAEEFYSTSKAGVIRGMHFQIPPYQHRKMVFVSRGTVVDVLVDLRRDSPTVGDHVEYILTQGQALLVPPGVAHGFATKTAATVHYKTSTRYSREHDQGIRYDSFGYDWRCQRPVVSDRDLGLPEMEKFLLRNPF